MIIKGEISRWAFFALKGGLIGKGAIFALFWRKAFVVIISGK